MSTGQEKRLTAEAPFIEGKRERGYKDGGKKTAKVEKSLTVDVQKIEVLT